MKKISLFVIFAALSWVSASAQTDPLKTLADRLNKFNNDLPVEKVHLHFDKPYYTIGDTIWFKGYVVSADQNELSALSDILYVDFINSNNIIKRSMRMPMSLASVRGDIVLADSLAEGNYRIRAYTNWMRNFGEEYFFDKVIPVGNALSNNIITKTTFTFAKVGNKENVMATINYSTLKEGLPLILKEVNYAIELNGRFVDRGKATTDSLGNINITFVNEKRTKPKSGLIQTSLKPDGIKVVSRIIPIKSTSDSVSVQFFPESGQMLEGVLSKMAFKAVSTDGLGADVSGYIIDKDNKKVTDFSSEHAGMGAFEIQPEPGNQYKAVIKYPDGSDNVLALPAARAKGYALRLDNSDKDNVKIQIIASQDVVNAGADIILIAQNNNNIYFTAKARLKGTVLNSTIPKARFPEGIAQFTLFAANNVPVAERLVFIDHADKELDIKLAANQPSYSTRQKVKVDMEIAGEPAGNFSVAVTNMSDIPVDEDTETTIFSSLLLSADLQGYVEKPNYYFTNRNEVKQKHFDNLLLTQGWRKFEWKQVLTGIIPKPKFAPEKGITITGTMVANSGKKPIARGRVMLFTPNSGALFRDTLTDGQGRFVFDNLVFADSAKFVVQARNEKERANVFIQLDRTAPQLVVSRKNAPDEALNTGMLMMTYLKNSSDTFDEMQRAGLLKSDIILEEVNVKTTNTTLGNKEKLSNSSNLNSAGHYDYLIKGAEIEKVMNLGTALQRRVPGISIAIDPYTNETVAVLSRNTGIGLGAGSIPMGVYVDGIYIGSDMGTVPTSNIATVEVLVSAVNTAIYGSHGAAGGIVVITTKRGNDATTDPDNQSQGVLTYRPRGYSIVRNFYSPVYAPDIKSNVPDRRTTVYWNPDFIISKDGNNSFEFYTADSPGTYRTVIEGLGLSGKLGRKVITYTVK